MDTSDCDLITLTEVSELGLTYTYKADAVKGKRWANLRSLECGELNAFSVSGDLENSETEAECCYRSKIETKKRHKEGAWADRGGTRFGG